MLDYSAKWTNEVVFNSGDGFFAALELDLRGAERSIELETYIFSDDSLGCKVVSLLKDAAHRGVNVRVMVDGVGSPSWAIRFLPELVAAGVETKIYHPLPWIFWSYSLIWRRGMNGVLSFFRRVNRRNHRKVCIIDRKRAWTGSMNVSAHHLTALSGSDAWRDTGVCVEGASIVHLVAAFEKAWRRARGPRKGVRRGFFGFLKRDRRIPFLVRLNNTLIRRQRYAEDLQKRIENAGRRIWITTPYFVPRKAVMQALIGAAGRGVDIRILLPSKSDVFFMSWVSAVFSQQLVQYGVRIFEYIPTVLHSKVVLADDWAMVGSSNWNHRSVLHDLEVDILLTSEKSMRTLEGQFQKDMEVSSEISRNNVKMHRLWQRLLGRGFLLFRYWL